MSQPHEEKLSALNDRIGAIDASLAKLDDDYIEAATGFDGVNGKESLRRAESIEAKQSALRREKALAIAAQAKVEELQRQQQQQLEQEQRHAQEIEAKGYADQIMALNVTIDQALAALGEQFARRANSLRAFQATGVGNATLLSKLSGKGPATRACCAAGLHEHIDLATVSPQGRLPLASANPVLIGIGRDAVPPRVQLRPNGNGAHK